jgi:hypothetical protein
LTADGQGVSLRPGAAGQEERLAELFDVVLDNNPFQRGRVEELGLGDRPAFPSCAR